MFSLELITFSLIINSTLHLTQKVIFEYFFFFYHLSIYIHLLSRDYAQLYSINQILSIENISFFLSFILIF